MGAKTKTGGQEGLEPPKETKANGSQKPWSQGHPRPLAREVRRGGFIFAQLWREEQWAIYSQTPSAHEGNAERVAAHEVIRIRVAPEEMIMGTLSPWREVYPTSAEWGSHGWTVGSFEEARAKVETLRATAAVIDTQSGQLKLGLK